MRGEQRSGRDQRGASEVLGAMLMFAILIAAIGVFQVVIVPQTNEEIEFKHSTQVRADMTDLRAAMVSTATDGGRRTVSVETGTSYPTRSLTVNPSDPRGRLATSGAVTGAVELQNVATTDPEAGDYWNGTATFDSRFVAYSPAYNYYDGAPVTRYEPTVVYSSFRSGDILETPQGLVDGRTLDVVLVSGSLSRSGSATESVDVVPVSTSTESVTITDPGPLRVKTHLSQTAWQKALSDEPNASVASYTTNADAPNVVEISLAAGEWDLHVSEVGMNSGGTTSPAYIEAVGSTERVVDGGKTVDLTVRVLDRYGNPVKGVVVNQTFAPNRTTGSDGTVTYEYAATSGNETLDVWFGSDSLPGDSARRVAFDVDMNRDQFGQQVNPSDGFVLDSVAINGSNGIDVTFRTTSGTVTVTSFRVNYYHANGQGNSASDPPTEWRVNGSDLRDVSGLPVAPDDGAVTGSGTFAFEFYWPADVSNPEVADSDLVVVTAQFGDGTSRLYMFSPPST